MLLSVSYGPASGIVHGFTIRIIQPNPIRAGADIIVDLIFSRYDPGGYNPYPTGSGTPGSDSAPTPRIAERKVHPVAEQVLQEARGSIYTGILTGSCQRNLDCSGPVPVVWHFIPVWLAGRKVRGSFLSGT